MLCPGGLCLLDGRLALAAAARSGHEHRLGRAVFYFAFYLPLFVGLARVAVHRLRVPVILAAPVVWTGLELARGRLLSGMTMASLGHTQYRWIGLIQLSDLAGAYGVSFVVMLVAAAVAGADASLRWAA